MPVSQITSLAHFDDPPTYAGPPAGLHARRLVIQPKGMGGDRRLASEYEELLRQHHRELKRRRTESCLKSPQATEDVPPPPEYTDSEDEWDEIELDHSEDEDEFGAPTTENDEVDSHTGDITVSLSPQPEVSSRRSPSIPRQDRLTFHTLCFAALTLHTRIRNAWTVSNGAITDLQNFLPIITQQELHPPAHLSYNLKTKKLMDGLRAAIRLWKARFTITSIGLYCVDWGEFKDTERVISSALSKEQFSGCLRKRTGSIDVFTQGFCALLRANSIDCRLVCSLQPPDFTSPGKSLKSRRPIEILDRPPIYWTEVWDQYSNQWISCDPCQGAVQLVRGKNAFEPKVTDSRNVMRYCLAWDRNSKVRDVTRRYASHYNARTRKKRLTHAGKSYARVYEAFLSRFSVRSLQRRDLEELKQLNRREATEGIPTRVQDFIGHPIYVLEHQLKKTEYLDPKVSCGRLALKDGASCPIYLRKNVHQCSSARSWYRKGRVIISGEQPKIYRSSKTLTGEEEQVGLYSKAQTELYVPEPVVGGRVPKSEYNTIDLFVSSMLPRGAAYIVNKLGERAAKLLQVDYARAVVGAEFDRRSVKSVYKGVVVPASCEEAVLAVCEGLEELEKQELKDKETLRVLMMWRRFIIGTRIWNRVEKMNPEPNKSSKRALLAAGSLDQTSDEAREVKEWDPGSDSDLDSNDGGANQVKEWDPGSDSDPDDNPVKEWDPGLDSDSDELLLETVRLKTEDDCLLVDKNEPVNILVEAGPATAASESSIEHAAPEQAAHEVTAAVPKNTRFTFDVNDILHSPHRGVPMNSLKIAETTPKVEHDSSDSGSDFPDVFLDEEDYV